MEKFIKTSRLAVIFFLVAALLVIYGSTLYELQVIEGDEYYEKSAGTVATTTSTAAARGSILDRNGTLLVSDSVRYSVMISRNLLLKSENPNDIVLTLIKLAQEYGVSYTDSFPVTGSGPFEFLADMSSTQRSRLEAYMDYFNLDENMSASDFMAWLREHYGISYTVTGTDARLIAGVRYELELRAIVNISEYIFASDVDIDFITVVSQYNFGCVQIETSSVREYHTSYAAHLLGNIGRLTSQEYETYRDKGYSLDSYIGKTGVEYTFEEYLHGSPGSVTTYTDSTGAVTNIVVNSEARAGQNVYLTIDIGLQEVAEKALAKNIASINTDRTEDEEKAEGGAVVVLDVNSAESLVVASYPTFDLSTYSQNFTALSSDPTEPLFNRATQGTYNPGSTFKMVTALAGLFTDTIDPSTVIKDEGVYTEYQSLGFAPRCWIYSSGSTHSFLDVKGALENSCNYFFYSIADQMDIDNIAAVASSFGFGEKTGIEIGEASGTLATREYKRQELGEGWWNADTLLTSIGQGYNMFTPIQIANYIATIANGGSRYSTSILDYITTSDYSAITYENSPTVSGVIEDPNGYMELIQEGMEAVAKTGTAKSVFGNYEIDVAAKTGTVQSDTASMNTGVFVCYAPADDPEIAIAVVVEKGGSGGAIMSVAKEILDAYFNDPTVDYVVVPEGALVK